MSKAACKRLRLKRKKSSRSDYERSSRHVNKSTRWGWTPLHFAAWHNQTSIVQLLLNRGANPNVPNDEVKLETFENKL